MTQSALDAVTRRVDNLERAARRWRVVSVLALGGISLLALVGAAQPVAAPGAADIRARSFTLIDDAGHERARLAMTFRTSSGDLEPELWVGGDGKGAKGTYIYSYGLSTRAGDGFVNLNPIGLLIALGNVEATINTGLGSSGPRLGLRGPSPSLGLEDEEGRTRAVLGDNAVEVSKTRGRLENRGPASLMLIDKDGKIIWQNPVSNTIDPRGPKGK